MKYFKQSVCILSAGIFSTSLMAEPAGAINSGDTAWVMISTGLVLLMIPGLAIFYGGLVRRKNVLGVLMQCFMALALISIQWVLFGYSLSFAPGHSWLGGLQWIGLKGVDFTPYSGYAPTIPHQLFMLYQSMFAAITPALIIGAFAERMKFSAYVLFILLWGTLVYDPVAHWLWGTDGWLKVLGAVDFAGGAVVHINAGIAALVSCFIIGKRKNYNDKPTPPHNLPTAVLGAGLLWFGWFGFNAGSALGANGLAVNALVTSNTSAAAAILSWALMERVMTGSATVLGVISGAIAGLAAITPAAGYVNVAGAMLIGFMSSVFCFLAVSKIKVIFKYDDSLDAFGIHGISGLWGMIATGIFATKTVNPSGVDGWLYGNAQQLFIQVEAAAATLFYSLVATLILYKAIDLVIGVRVKEKDEYQGLDISQHNERAYTLVE
jgi:ammonium transporter, Amt family